MLKSLCIVGLGSFMGGALRYLIATWLKNACPQGFPWGTLLVNLLGCFLIGVFYGWFSRYAAASHPACLFLTTGFCGGFTTFSTFSNESLQLLQTGNWGGFFSYVFISLVVGIGLTAIGYWTAN